MKITYQHHQGQNQVPVSVIMNKKNNHKKSRFFTFKNLTDFLGSKTITNLRFENATTDRSGIIFSLAKSVTLACPWKHYDVQFFYLCDMVSSDPSFKTQTIELDTEKDIELFAHFIWLMQFKSDKLNELLRCVSVMSGYPE